MNRIDRMDWKAGLTFRAYGLRIRVRVNDAEVLRLLPKHLPYGWKQTHGEKVERLYSLFRSRRSHILFAGTVELARSLQWDHLIEAFEREVRLFVAEHARRRVFVHAAAVGWNGQAILIPGKSMSGKTSLAAEFVRAGAIYYSDEYAVLDAKGRVHPYAKPLSIRNIEDGYSQTDSPVEAFGGRAGTRPLPVGLVLVTKYRQGSQWRPRQLSPAMGAMALLANTVAARRQPEKTMDVLKNALGTSRILKSVRGEAMDLVESMVRFDNLSKAARPRTSVIGDYQ